MAVALGAGGIKGWAHVGVLKVLHQAGIPIDLAVGASAGALIGPLYAARCDIEQMERTALSFSQRDFVDWFLRGLRLSPYGGRIGRELWEAYGRLRFEELAMPFAAVAHDVRTGARLTLREGRLSHAVEASIRPPFWGRPSALNGTALLDGGFQQAVPSDIARELGSSFVIAVNLGRFVSLPAAARPHSARVASSWRRLGTMPAHPLSQAAFMAELLSREIGGTPRGDIEIRPDMCGISAFAPWQTRRAVRRGEAAARAALPAIRLALGHSEVLPGRGFSPAPRPLRAPSTGTPRAPG